MRCVGRILWSSIGLLCGAIAAAVVVWILIKHVTGANRRQVEVPDVVGKSEIEARQLLTAKHLYPNFVIRENSIAVPAGHVLRLQGLEAGQVVREGKTVTLIVNLGPRAVKVPNVTDRGLIRATSRLEELGLAVGNKVYVHHAQFKKDYVIGQQPAEGFWLTTGSEVHLIVSKGKEQLVELPFPVGSRISDGHKAASVTIKVGKGPLSQSVEFILIDDDGKKTIYQGTHAPGDVIERIVMGRGELVTVQVLIDGIRHSEKQF